MTTSTGIEMKNRRFGTALPAAVFAALLLCSAGCGVVEKRTGIVTSRVTESHKETRNAPVAGWMVEVYVNGGFVGTWQTNAYGEVAFNIRPYIPNAIRANNGLQIEFRFRQQDGTVESKKLYFTPEQLRNS